MVVAAAAKTKPDLLRLHLHLNTLPPGSILGPLLFVIYITADRPKVLLWHSAEAEGLAVVTEPNKKPNFGQMLSAIVVVYYSLWAK